MVWQGETRLEDDHLLRGRTLWTSSVHLPDALHAVIVRSPIAAADIRKVGLDAVRAAPGVIAAYDGAGVAALGATMQGLGGTLEPPMPLVAIEAVRFVGEPVAVVLARTAAEAHDAAALTDLDLVTRPAVVNARAAVVDGAPLVHADVGGNVAFAVVNRPPEVDEAIAQSPVVIRRVFRLGRVSPAAIEPRAVVVQPHGQGLTMWVSSQVPRLVRTLLARALGLPKELIRVVAPDVGGAFGGKFFYPEDVLIAALARSRGVPVSWTATRNEDLFTTMHSRVVEQEVVLGADRDGRLRVLDVNLLSDVGAYAGALGPGVVLGGVEMLPGAYRVPVFGLRALGVFTNCTPVGAYRGAGRPEATFAIERAMDELAHELALDPAELRRRNFVAADEFPHDNGAGLVYDSGQYAAALDAALDLAGYDQVRSEQRRRRAAGDPIALGIGVSSYVEACGSGVKISEDDIETMTVRLRDDGDVEVLAASTAYGQGHVTTWTQLVCEVLGVSPEQVHVHQGDTAAAPDGFDSYGSRTVPVLGPALIRSAQDLADAALKVAADLLEASADDLELSLGEVRVKGEPVAGVSLRRVAEHARTERGRVLGLPEDLAHPCGTDLDILTFPSGTHIAVAEVDTETGQVRIRDYVAVDDVGTVINPMIVDGQIHGGVVQGIGEALYEEFVYDSDGSPLTASLTDYGVPSAVDVPPIRTARIITPSPATPLGAKGAGEAGATGSMPAVINAVIDALRPLAVTTIDVPATPQRVWQLVQGAQAGSARGIEPLPAWGSAAVDAAGSAESTPTV
jgi:carbon-monoxide dehydrogenase large subunit